MEKVYLYNTLTKTVDEFKTHDTKTIYKGPLGEEGIRNDYITQFQQLLFIVMERQQIVCYKRIFLALFHTIRFATSTELMHNRLHGTDGNCFACVGIDQCNSENLQTSLHSLRTA